MEPMVHVLCTAFNLFVRFYGPLQNNASIFQLINSSFYHSRKNREKQRVGERQRKENKIGRKIDGYIDR